MNLSKVEKDLISEIKLQPIEARTFILVTTAGKMGIEKIANKLDVSIEDATSSVKRLMELGAFIDFSESEYEAMHPRFTVVNMYRKMCEKNKIQFKRNKILDNIGSVLEKYYDDARTK